MGRWQFMADMQAKRQQLEGFKVGDMECRQTLGEPRAGRPLLSTSSRAMQPTHPPFHASTSKSELRAVVDRVGARVGEIALLCIPSPPCASLQRQISTLAHLFAAIISHCMFTQNPHPSCLGSDMGGRGALILPPRTILSRNGKLRTCKAVQAQGDGERECLFVLPKAGSRNPSFPRHPAQQHEPCCPRFDSVCDRFLSFKLLPNAAGFWHLAPTTDTPVAAQVYAIKMISKAVVIKTKQIAHIQAEKEILASISHPFIINL